MFQDTQDCNNAYIQSACSSISTSLGIHWPAVTWSDLRKPLYSGVAAALSTLLTLGSQSISGNVTAQANLWVQMYGGQSTTFSDTADQASAVGKTVWVPKTPGTLTQNTFSCGCLHELGWRNVTYLTNRRSLPPSTYVDSMHKQSRSDHV